MGVIILTRGIYCNRSRHLWDYRCDTFRAVLSPLFGAHSASYLINDNNALHHDMNCAHRRRSIADCRDKAAECPSILSKIISCPIWIGAGRDVRRPRARNRDRTPRRPDGSRHRNDDAPLRPSRAFPASSGSAPGGSVKAEPTSGSGPDAIRFATRGESSQDRFRGSPNKRSARPARTASGGSRSGTNRCTTGVWNLAPSSAMPPSLTNQDDRGKARATAAE